MNAVEIEEAVSTLAAEPFDAVEFPYAFLRAFGNKETTIKRLRAGASNRSDLGGVLQTSNIHIGAVGPEGVTATLRRLKDSPATTKAKVRFILATDGITFEAEDLDVGDTVVCEYGAFPDHFGFFLPLAGISAVRQLRESSFDIRATSRLNRLYRTLLEENPDWDSAERRPDMNHFMARLIFCFFAEDTGIFHPSHPFTGTVETMSERDSSNTHEVIGELFRAMNTNNAARDAAGIARWARPFAYVNGGLFSGTSDVPRFSRIARSYLLHIGGLDWTKINPDIFGSMIQAVADDEERGALGMHYTSVPNILKVLNPLFLDDLREKLDEAGDNARKLLNLRNRMARIRIFDPACGSGNFLVIAYKQMREIEAEINCRRGESERPSDIPLTNFRGIELRDFPAEVARLALIIAEYQSDVLYRGQQLALAEFLPLDAENWITCGNALRVDWLSVCPPTGMGVKYHADDLFDSPLAQAQIDFENEGGETYICGNPQFKGARKQSKSQKSDMSDLFFGNRDYQDCDYVIGWYLKASDYAKRCDAAFAFVSTSSISEGEQVAHLWSRLYVDGCHINFAHRGFKWRNNASNNAAVQCVIIGVGTKKTSRCRLFDGDMQRDVETISPYLIAGSETYVRTRESPLSPGFVPMAMGSMARDGGHLILTNDEASTLLAGSPEAAPLVRGLSGSQELIHVRDRKCLWIEDDTLALAQSIPEVLSRVAAVKTFRLASTAKTTITYAAIPHKFAQRAHKKGTSLIVAATSSEEREFIPTGFLDENVIVTNAAYVVYNPQLWYLAVISSTMHMKWVETVCGKLETRLRYSSTLGWNTFPLQSLTEKQEADLACCAQDILLAREAHFPSTIAELYDPERMPDDLRAAHERNDEVLERIYIGRKFRNDTERLEKLFELYTKMAGAVEAITKRKAGA